MTIDKNFKRAVYLTLLMTGAAQAQSIGSSTNYSGFGMSALSSLTTTPYRSTTQDLDAVFEGNALISQSSLMLNGGSSQYQGYTAPFMMTTVSGASSNNPLIAAPSLELQTLMTTMGLPVSSSFGGNTNILNQSAANYVASVAAGSVAVSPQSIMTETAAQAQAAAASTPSGIYITTYNGNNALTANMGALAPYNAQTIMYPNADNYTPKQAVGTSPAGGTAGSYAQQYMALVTGSIAPVTGMLTQSNFGGPNSSQNFNAYQLLVAREAAVQTAAAATLEKYAMNNAPLSIQASSLGSHFVSTKMTPSINNIAQFMSTRRLDPNSGWYYRVAQASSLEMQRESLYLQAESLYELNQIHQDLQQNSLLMSLMLIEQTRTNIGMINQANQVTAAQTGAPANTTTSTTSSVPMS